MSQSARVCALPSKGDRFAVPAHPEWPKLRAGTQLDALYERLTTRGVGFRKPGIGDGRPRVIVVFDPRCSWSHEFWRTSGVLEDAVDFVWYPVCVTADLSTAQAASILAADVPWELMQEHQEAFADPDFCGIHPEEHPSEQKHRDLVWENARIFRKAGGTSVPLAVWRSPEGRFVPFFGDSTAAEIRAALEL